MINFICRSTTIAIILLASTAYGQCEYIARIYNIQYAQYLNVSIIIHLMYVIGRASHTKQLLTLKWDIAYSEYSTLH